jgi:hypothetical protein
MLHGSWWQAEMDFKNHYSCILRISSLGSLNIFFLRL